MLTFGGKVQLLWLQSIWQLFCDCTLPATYGKIIKYRIFIIIMLLSGTSLQAQEDSLWIQTIEISETRKGMEKQMLLDAEVQPNQQTGPLTRNIASHSFGFARSYGLGSSATLSIRGGSANQNLLIWNGVPLNNPMLGLADYSLVPASFFSKAELLLGSQSARFGSSAMTGVVMLSGEIPVRDPNSLTFSSSTGSFGHASFYLDALYNDTNWSSHTRAFHAGATNDFSYTPSGSTTTTKISNGKLLLKGMLQSFRWNPAKNHLVHADVWIQDVHREIPPLTTQTSSEAAQADKQYRLLLRHNFTGKKLYLNHSLAFISERNRYKDAQIFLETENRFRRLFQVMEAGTSISEDITLIGGYNLDHTRAESQSYAQPKQQISFSPYLNYQHRLGQHELSIAVRNQITSTETVPFILLVENVSNWSEHWRTFIKISKEYRLPTLNELYWQPGGSDALVPEQGWSQEMGVLFALQQTLELRATTYHRLIENWILWSPGEGTPYFTVSNIQKVRSLGVEGMVRGSLGRSLTHDWNLGYSFTRSFNLFSSAYPFLEKGAQLIYTPIHTALASYSLSGKDFMLRCHGRFTGPTSGINEDLPGYLVADLVISWMVQGERFKLEVSPEIRNFTDSEYRVLERRPMPGRHYILTIKLQLK